MTMVRRNSRFDKPVPIGSLAEIEQEIADVLDVIDRVQKSAEEAAERVAAECDVILETNPLWQLAEAVKGLAWAVGSLAHHHENLAVEVATRGAK
ncbi:hypothetical protein GCM10011390_10340 [Aureimonas endophytica]|uniref:Uncharacterized protein n=1 Tax=Aureimonas endophytica TaxID=2027858 RepID=A0A916ZF37_9HYPH|nr:hypothetical protein [Aureimonas endophytica]GGD93492.1 hypothetical protein GCM10011390_10340 [Aureimonas endophytica]